MMIFSKLLQRLSKSWWYFQIYCKDSLSHDKMVMKKTRQQHPYEKIPILLITELTHCFQKFCIFLQSDCKEFLSHDTMFMK